MGHGFLLARAPWGFCTEGRDWSARQLSAGTDPSADHVAGQVQRTSGCCRQSPKGGAFITAYRGGELILEEGGIQDFGKGRVRVTVKY